MPGFPSRPSRFRAVHIVTYGRSGSTLLMGLLNSIDGYLIRGENFNCFDHLRRFAHDLHRTRERQGPDATFAWFNAIDEKRILERLSELQREVLAVGPGVRVYGFKEIRYIDMPRKELFALLDFLHALAPPTAFIFNTRDWRQVGQSKWWAKVSARTVRRKINRFENRIEAYHQRHPDRCFRIDYNDVKNGTARVRQLFDFLGEGFDTRKYSQVLNVRHSF